MSGGSEMINLNLNEQELQAAMLRCTFLVSLMRVLNMALGNLIFKEF